MIGFVLLHYMVIIGLGFISYLLGRELLMKVRFASIWEEIVFSTSLGLGCIGYLVLSLGILGMLNGSNLLFIFLILAAVSVFYSPIRTFWLYKLAAILKRVRMFRKSSVRYLIFIFISVIVLLPIMLMPLYPPITWDSIMYHLAAAKIYVQEHHIKLTPYLRFPVFPRLNEMLFTLMLSIMDDIAAQLVQFLMMVLVAGALYSWGCRMFSSKTGLWAAALWLGNPLVLWLGSSAYIDIGLTLFVTLTVYSFWNWLYSKEWLWLILAGVFVGFAAGSKYSALVFIALLGIIVFYISIRERRYLAPWVFITIATAIAAPWYLRNFYYTGNPVFPFFSTLFGYNYLYSSEDLKLLLYDLQHARGIGRSFTALLTLPWHLAFNQDAFIMEAPLSQTYFFAIPILLVFSIFSTKIRGMLALVLAYLLFWFLSAQIVRYLVPVLPLLSLLTATVVERFLLWLPLLRRWSGHAVITGIIAILLVLPGWLYATHKVLEQGPVPVTQDQRDIYLARHLLSYPAYKFLNDLKGRNYTLYALYDENMAYFADGQFMGDWFGPARYSRIATKLGDSQGLYEELKTLGANYFLINKQRGKVELPDDGFFQSHFKLIYARAYVLLFELSEKPLKRKLGLELLKNSGFENLEGRQLNSWQHVGKPVIDTSGLRSHSGFVAVRSEGTENVFYQAVPVKPQGLYLLSYYARADRQGQIARLQVNWSNEQGRFLKTDIELVDIGADWKQYEMAVTAPPQAAWATVYVSPHEQSSVWFDDFSFVEVTYTTEGETTRASPLDTILIGTNK
ncbi:MAG: ArnT family glycosyltransferase [Moorellaceae bacterium]